MGGIAWSEEEDHLLKKCIEQHGEGKWHRIPLLSGLNRCPKSCRFRWMNYLRPNIRRGSFAEDEIDLIVKLHKLLGNRWSLIAARLPGRTGNDIKNYWKCHLSRKLNAEEDQKEEKPMTTKVEDLRPQTRYCNATLVVQPPPPPRLEEIPNLQASQEASNSLILPHPEFEQSQNVESSENPGNEDVNFGDLLVDTDLDFEQVILTDDYKTSGNWERDDDLMVLDMDIWTQLF